MRTTTENGILITEEEAGDSHSKAPAPEVIAAEYLEPYKLHITFSDGVSRVVDFESTMRQFRPLQKFLRLKEFTAFRLYNGNLQWNDYEMIFPTEQLYNGLE